MPNFKKHAATGATIGGGAALLFNLVQQANRKAINRNYRFDFGELLIKSAAGAGIGAFCGVLPDRLEPATSPHHRKFFHSGVSAASIGYGLKKAHKSKLMESF